MAAKHHNISSELTQVLLASGTGVNVTSVSIANLHASTSCTVDLYIEKQLTGKFYIIKTLLLPVGATLVLEGNDVKFNNKANEFGLYIKLNKIEVGDDSPAVDVIIN